MEIINRGLGFGEIDLHKKLKEEGKKILKQLGYKDIETEYTYKNNKIFFRFDVVGFKEGGIGLVECGGLSNKKLEKIKKISEIKYFLHLPYKEYSNKREGKKPKDEGRVRIAIGKIDYGGRTLKKPTKTITLIKTSVQEIYKKIMKMIEDENKSIKKQN